MERISAGIRKNQPKDRPRRELVQALRGSQPCGIAIVCFSLISGQPLAMAQETPEPAPSTGIPSVVGPLPPLQLAPPQLAPPELAPPRIPTSQLPPLQIGPSSQIELKRWNEIPRSGIVLDAGPREAMESAEPASPFQAAQRSVPAPFRSRIPNGLPDLPSSETSLFRSRLVSSDPDSYSDPDIGSRGGTNDEGALDEGKSEGITDRAKKLTKQLVAMEQRLVRTFPQDYLLDALDPGLFGTEEAPWLPAPQLRVNNVPARLVATAEAAWAALHPELTERLKRADGFLRQRSIYSAREEIRAGLTALSRKLDQLANTENESSGSQRKLAIRKSMPHESSLQHAFRALDECGFVPQEEIGENLQTFVDLIPRATLNHPWASDLVYALGKTYEHEYEQDPKRAEVIRKQALECFVVASRIAPRRGALANQLGYSYLQAGMTEEAFKALRQSLDAGPTATTWRNLAELYRRQGATREARLADEQAEYLLKME